MAGPEEIHNPALSEIASVGTGTAAAAPIATPATLGVTDKAGRPIPNASISSAIAVGEATFAPDRVYDLIDSDGMPKRVKGEHVYNAMRRGWGLESPEGKELRLARQNATLGGKLAAGALGVGESLTLGTLPALYEGFTGKEGARAYRKTRAASEEAATIGEVLGLLTPIGVEGAIAKGVGTASKLGRGAMTAAELATIAPRTISGVARGVGKAAVGALPESTTALGQALKKGAQFGVEGAVEGAVYGGGFAVGEASLGDSELSAERMLAAVGTGAFLGAGIGGGLGAASVGASRVATKIGAELPGVAEKMAFRSTGARGSEMRRVGLDQARASGRRMLDEGLVGFKSLEERAAALRKATENAGQDIGRLIEKIDDTGARPMLAPIIRKFDEQLGKLREGIGADVKLAKKLDRDFGEWFRERIASNKSPTFKELHKIRGRVDDYLEKAKRGQDTVTEAQLRRFRANIEEEIQSQADKLARGAGDEFSGAYTAAKARYKDLIKATEIAEKMAPMQSAQSFGFLDKAAAVGGLLTAGPVGLLAAGASKLAREHGDSAAALLANKVSSKAKRKPTLAEVMSGAPGVANDVLPTPQMSPHLQGGAPASRLRPLTLDDVAEGMTHAANDNRAARRVATTHDAAQKQFDKTARKVEKVSHSGKHSDVLDQFLNTERRAVSKAEIEGIKNEISDQVTSFLQAARKRNADYKGQVFRGASKAELDRIAEGGSNSLTWSVSKDREGALHFAKKKKEDGVMFVIQRDSGAIPVDGLKNSNTFNEALVPKGSHWRIAGETTEDGVRVVTLEPTAPRQARPGTPDHLLAGPQLPYAAPANDLGPHAANDLFALDEAVVANNNTLQAATELAQQRQLKDKLEALGYVKAKADKVTLQIAKAAKDAVTTGAHKVIPKVPAGAAAYELLAADAREHRAAPDRSALKIAARVEPLLHSAPKLAAAVTVKMTGDLEYLANQLPSAGNAGLSPEQAKKVVPSGSERASFVRQARAIADPKTLLLDMRKGELSQDAINAIKERRPLLLAQIQEETAEAYAKLVQEGKAPSRQARLQIEKLLGYKIDPASNTTVIKIVQETYRKRAKAMTASVSPTPQTSTKRADRLMSQSESIARGD